MVLIVQTKDATLPSRHVNAPPPYTPLAAAAPPRTPGPASPFRSSPTVSFDSLPPHILLQIVNATVPPQSLRTPEYYIESLYWLTHSLRLVSRSTYIACMNFLRSTFLTDYLTNIKHPYTCDPFPLEPPEASLPPQYQRPQAIVSLQREMAVLDRFIALKCSEDVRSYQTELHLDLDHFKDLFELEQPKARTEDLIRKYGMRAGVVSLVAPPLATSTPISRLPTPLPFSAISVNFSPRKVGVTILRRTVVDVRRDRDETLESVAKRLVKELARVLGRAG